MPLNFPNSPSIGQTYGRYVWNGTAWTLMADARNFTDYTLTSSGTWTKPVGLLKLEVTLVGGGGGATGCSATVASQACGGAGGGGGAVVMGFYDADELAATEAYTIGAQGASPGAVGGAGGDTIFKSLTAGGGGGGGAMMAVGTTTTVSPAYGGSGAASDSDSRPSTRLLHGINGEQGIRLPHGLANYAIGGRGGGNHFARSQQRHYVTSTISAVSGTFPGGGAAGGAIGPSQSAIGGALGGAGVIYLREWYQ